MTMKRTITSCAAVVSSLFVLCCCAYSTADVLQPGFNQVPIGSISGGTRAFGVGMAGFNGDLIPDIISGQTNGDVILFTGDGYGGFTNAGRVINQAYNNAYGLSVADFNGDTFMDFVLTMTVDSATYGILNGEIHLYLGNGDGTFQAAVASQANPQAGIAIIGDVGEYSAAVTSGDVDGDGDIDIIAGDVTMSANALADIMLFRNGLNNPGMPLWSAGETIVSAANITADPDLPPYYPPINGGPSYSYPHAYGLALGDLDNDNDLDLLVTDRAGYLYIYRNDGTGTFGDANGKPIYYNNVSTGTRPYAYNQLHALFAPITIACGDFNGDGLVDFVTGSDGGTWEGAVDLWLNTGLDGSNRPRFLNAGIIGQNGTDAKGLAVGHINPLGENGDSFVDIVFGNNECVLTGLLTDRKDTDGDGIIDLYDNAPLHANAPRLDINDDGGINYMDQLDNDQDGIGDPADTDDDNDGIFDDMDNCPFVANSDQTDTDGDGIGDACDPLNNTDTDGDTVFDGPVDPVLYQKAQAAKALWSNSDTHFIIRIDALGRVFQNEFTQTMTDGAILSPEEWALNKNFSYNGVGDDPATAGYQVPTDLPGGKNTPITLVTIPKQLWYAYGDTDPIRWINTRLSNSNLEIGQHGTYHDNNTMLGDWATMTDRNYYSCETCGFTVEEMFQYLRVGQRTLAGDYLDWWLQDSGANPDTSPKIDWTNAANPLISYAPPYNAYDTPSRDATAQLGYVGFSAFINEEKSLIFSPDGNWHEQFDQFGMFHASADWQVNPEYQGQGSMTYEEYLDSITQYGQLNTWLIEEVEWSTRYCNNLPRLVYCSVTGTDNRENNMVDPERWTKWMTLLDFVNANGQPMTMGDYSLAMAFDNAPTVYNPGQADSDHDGIGDAIDGAILTAADVAFTWNGSITEGTLTATMTKDGTGIAGQTLQFAFDADGDGTAEQYTAATGTDGTASLLVQTTLWGGLYAYTAAWDAGVMQLSDEGQATVPCTLQADLTGDCHVLLDDLAVLAGQWLQSGDPAGCLLQADLALDDCHIDLQDFAVMAQEWQL
jgi:hypothetical protein